jgi:hypothetical protein
MYRTAAFLGISHYKAKYQPSPFLGDEPSMNLDSLSPLLRPDALLLLLF